jgi:tRNA-intron endonuclease
MQLTGELIKNTILLKKPKDIGRLYTKSHFGTPFNKDKLKLDLIEGVLLLGEQKIKIFHKKNEVTFQELVKFAQQHIADFEIKYLVLKDLRSRGLAIKQCKDGKPTTFYQVNRNTTKSDTPVYISALSERAVFDYQQTKELITTISKKNGELWFAIVDEEGDITYYQVSTFDVQGTNQTHVFPKGTGLLLKNRVVIFDKKLINQLFTKEFFGKTFGEGLQLSLVEGLYLFNKNQLDIQTSDGRSLSPKELLNHISTVQPDISRRIIVFEDLKHRGLLVKTGFKFGSHFRIYTKHPDKGHAEYLIHVVDKKYISAWSEISRAVRLAHSVNKEIIFARVHGTIVDYIRFGRLRP